jgi:carbon monoxide dehydrogenase subunit G
MDIAGSYTFDVPPEQVWVLLMDPAVIASCIPGCDTFEPTGENSYRARLTVALAAITGSYDGVVTLSDIVPHSSYRLNAEGKGRPGFVKGSANVTLRVDGAATIVDVAGTVQTGGPIARLGQRLIGGVSKMMMDRFFNSVVELSRAYDRAIATDNARRANT